MSREYVTIKKAAATTTTMAINVGLKSTGSLDGGGGAEFEISEEVGDGDVAGV